jgi:hypothetical protein
MIEINPFTVRNILSSRAIFTTIGEKISYELVNENVLMQEFNQISYNHNFDLIATSIFIVCAVNILYIPSKEKKAKLENIEYFTNTKNITSKYLFLFMLIFTKNIESAT